MESHCWCPRHAAVLEKHRTRRRETERREAVGVVGREEEGDGLEKEEERGRERETGGFTVEV